jgi:hypothetical protein
MGEGIETEIRTGSFEVSNRALPKCFRKRIFDAKAQRRQEKQGNESGTQELRKIQEARFSTAHAFPEFLSS